MREVSIFLLPVLLLQSKKTVSFENPYLVTSHGGIAQFSKWWLTKKNPPIILFAENWIFEISVVCTLSHWKIKIVNCSPFVNNYCPLDYGLIFSSPEYPDFLCTYAGNRPSGIRASNFDIIRFLVNYCFHMPRFFPGPYVCKDCWWSYNLLAPLRCLSWCMSDSVRLTPWFLRRTLCLLTMQPLLPLALLSSVPQEPRVREGAVLLLPVLHVQSQTEIRFENPHNTAPFKNYKGCQT